MWPFKKQHRHKHAWRAIGGTQIRDQTYTIVHLKCDNCEELAAREINGLWTTEQLGVETITKP